MNPPISSLPSCLALSRGRRSPVSVDASVRSSTTHPLGDAIETFVRQEDAERFVEEVRGDDPDLASYMQIEERELEAV